MGCEHELYCIEENNISEEEVRVVFKCSLCDAEYSGVIKRCT